MKNQRYIESVVWGAFAVLTLFYLYHVNPYAGFHDSLSYMDTAVRGFHLRTHATAHWLYANMLYLVSIIFPVDNHALLFNLFSAGCSLVTLALAYRLITEHRIGRLPAVASVMVLATAYTYLSQSMTIEAYALNNLLWTAYMLLMFRDFRQGVRKNYLWISVLLGLALLTHIQNVLALPVYLYYLLWKRKLETRKILQSLGVLGGLVFILFVPVVFWEAYPAKVIFFDFQFRDAVLATGINVWLKGLAKGMGYFLYNFTLFSPLVLWGGYLCYRHYRPFFLPWMLALLPWLIFSVRYDISDVYVYYLVPYIIFAVFVAMAFQAMPLRLQGVRVFVLGALLLSVQPGIYYLFANYGAPQVRYLDGFGEPKAYKGGYDYYFWPGRRQAPDPLERARVLHDSGDTVAICEAAEQWNLRRAYDYLHFRGEISDHRLPECGP